MNIKLYLDGADLDSMAALIDRCDGVTTNPSLCRKAGVTDYREFARRVLAIVGGRPVSFEVLADDLSGMERQAQEIAGWGDNVFVKIPITNTAAESTAPLIERLAASGVRVNVTAVLTKAQVREAVNALNGAEAIVSIFCGRIRDTGRDALQTVRYAMQLTAVGGTSVLWASTREIYNVYEAEEVGCDIITVAPDLLKKLGMRGRDLTALSLDTVKQFYRDAKEAGLCLE